MGHLESAVMSLNVLMVRGVSLVLSEHTFVQEEEEGGSIPSRFCLCKGRQHAQGVDETQDSCLRPHHEVGKVRKEASFHLVEKAFLKSVEAPHVAVTVCCVSVVEILGLQEKNHRKSGCVLPVGRPHPATPGGSLCN